MIGQAVSFASSLGARVTFFHAQANFAASIRGDAEIVRMTSPGDYVYAFEGKAREMLAKAESAARALGVPCASMTAVNDSPWRAIVDAAHEANCDLIFMGSHGRRSQLGMMLGSQTLKVLSHAGIPVLVAATSNPDAPTLAVGIIRDEHRSLAAVLHAWLHLLKEAGARKETPDLKIMQAMIHYIKAFPVALHHPKEEDFLFRKLRERTSLFNAELDELERQHERDLQLVESLVQAVAQQARGEGKLEDIEHSVARYAQFIWEHMGREEGVILPAAQKHLTEADWADINDAFSANQDPSFAANADAEYKRLFSRIVNLVPADSAGKPGR